MYTSFPQLLPLIGILTLIERLKNLYFVFFSKAVCLYIVELCIVVLRSCYIYYNAEIN